MDIKLGLVVAAMLGAFGCATSGTGRRGPSFAGIDSDAMPSVRVGELRVIDPHVNPMVPVHVTSENNQVAVTFGLEHSGAHERIDAVSLQPLSWEPSVREDRSTPSTEVTRVVLDGNRFLLCWTEGTLEAGHRAMAQMRRAADGAALGAPVQISPPDADVFGTPQAVTTDSHHVVATFAASSEGTFRLVAVAIDDVASVSPSELTARK
ncbi:MAG: hypothetical protein ACLP1X_00005 [Polyangiaceae bacterium]|jgi:hypothetical protein